MELSKRVKQLSPSATLAITSTANAMKREGKDVVSFGAGEPDYDTPGYIKAYAITAINQGKTKYTPSVGTLELRKAIADKLLKFNNIEYDPTDIVVSNGAKHSLFNIFQAICEDGDEVIIPAPYWVSYPEIVKLSGAKPVIVNTLPGDSYKIKPEALRCALTRRTRAIIINSPCNPTGSVYTKKELEDILKELASRNIRIISDEIYERLIYGSMEHVSIASLNKKAKDLTIVVSGVSKTYAMTGWRIGYLASNDKALIEAINNLQDHSSSNPSSISQEAALAALTKEDNSVEEMRMEFQSRRDYMVKRLKGIKELSFVKPDGAFYCFVDVSNIDKDSLKFAKELLDNKLVAVIPGEGFGAGGHIRLSFATSMENIKNGLDRIEIWVRQQQRKY